MNGFREVNMREAVRRVAARLPFDAARCRGAYWYHMNRDDYDPERHVLRGGINYVVHCGYESYRTPLFLFDVTIQQWIMDEDGGFRRKRHRLLPSGVVPLKVPHNVMDFVAHWGYRKLVKIRLEYPNTWQIHIRSAIDSQGGLVALVKLQQELAEKAHYQRMWRRDNVIGGNDD